jgi:hypothetical protein
MYTHIPLTENQCKYLEKKCDCVNHPTFCESCVKDAKVNFMDIMCITSDKYNNIMTDQSVKIINKLPFLSELYTILNTHPARVFTSYFYEFRITVFERIEWLEEFITMPFIKVHCSVNCKPLYDNLIASVKDLKSFIQGHFDKNGHCKGCARYDPIKRFAKKKTRSSSMPEKYSGVPVLIPIDGEPYKYYYYWTDYCDSCKAMEMAKYE